MIIGFQIWLSLEAHFFIQGDLSLFCTERPSDLAVVAEIGPLTVVGCLGLNANNQNVHLVIVLKHA